MAYQPMTLSVLAGHLAREPAEATRWKLVWEFMEEYGWEPPVARYPLLRDEPPPTGDTRWDALLAAIADHLAEAGTSPPPPWTASRVLTDHWYPAPLQAQRDDARTTAPPAFRRHGVYLSATDLTSA
jgi:hypothetical protein